MIRRISILGILGALLLAACERFPVGDAFDIDLKERQELSDKRKLHRMRVDIVKMAGEAECEAVEDCRFLELGAKPCGGPWEYLVYSVVQMDSTVLAKHVAKHNRFESQMNARYGYASDCALPPEPQLACVAGRCVDLNRTE